MILALLSPKLLRHLEYVVARRQPIVAVASLKQATDVVANSPVEIFVVDPSTEGAGNSIEFSRLFTSFPSLPVLAYVPVTPAAFRAVSDLSKVGLGDVVLYAHEDSPDHLRAILDASRASTLTRRVLEVLSPKLNSLPIALAKSVHEMFDAPHRYSCAHDLAVTANLPTSRLYRAFQSVDLAPPRKVLIAAKILRAYTYLGDPGHSVQGVSRKLGYRKSRIFAEQAREVFGINPSRLRAHVPEENAVRRLIAWCELPR